MEKGLVVSKRFIRRVLREDGREVPAHHILSADAKEIEVCLVYGQDNTLRVREGHHVDNGVPHGLEQAAITIHYISVFVLFCLFQVTPAASLRQAGPPALCS